MVYIVILNYNNFRCTDFCLDSLRHISFKNVKTILVDNNSTDGSFEKLIGKYKEVIPINSSENCGFARGTNLGMKYAYENNAEYIILLNNDIEVTSDFIQELIKPTLNDSNVGLVTPKILYREQPNLIWHAGGNINKSTISPVARGYDEIDNGQYDFIDETQWASGACCLITRKLVDKIGFLNEAYFFGQEEWDYSSSAIEAGFKIVYNHKSKVYHEIGQSSVKNPALYAYQNIYNKFVYADKFLNRFQFYYWAFKYINYLILFFPKKNLPHSPYDDFYKAKAKKAALMGVRDYFKGVYINAELLEKINNKLKKEYLSNK